MKKLFGCILSLVMAVMLVFTPAEHVYAQGLGLSVSSSSVAVGKTVKVTVSMPSGYFGTVVISSSDEGVLSNGGDGVANIGDAAGPEYPTSRSFSFTAKAAGSCTIKAYCTSCRRCRGQRCRRYNYRCQHEGDGNKCFIKQRFKQQQG